MTILAHNLSLRPALRLAVKAPAATLDRLIGLNLAAIQATTRDYLSSGNLDRWQREMERHLTTAHTAAYIAATAERLNIPADSPLISRNRLSRAEKADIRAAVDRQLTYLAGFVRDIESGKMSPAQIAARANLYGPSIKAFYYAQRWGDWEIPGTLLPGNQQCLSNCLCRLTGITDNGDGTGVLNRVMGGTEDHCSECPALEGDHPIRRRRAA